MNRFKKSRLVIFSTLVSLLVLFLILLSLNVIPLSSITLGPLAKVERVISYPVSLISKTRTHFVDLLQTYDENRALKNKLSQMENQAQRILTLQAENASLKQALDLPAEVVAQRLVHGEVTLRLPNSWLDVLNVNVGRAAGVTDEMLVVANGGLVGYIKEMGEQATSVQLLTSSSERLKKVPIKINTASSAVYGILTSYNASQKMYVITQLDSEAEIAPGDWVVSSDLGGKLPANVPVGQVEKVISNSTNLGREIYVRPSADFNNIYTVSFVGK